MSSTRLVQLRRGSTRRVARVEEPSLRLLDAVGSVLELAERAIAAGISLPSAVERHVSGETLELRFNLWRFVGLAAHRPDRSP